MKWLILILGVLSNTSASVLIKIAMTQSKGALNIKEPLTLLLNWPLMLGIFLYGMAFLLYALSLTRLPLSIAHPILTSGAIALVAVASIVFFGEKLSGINILGFILIITGVIALTLR